MQLAMLIILEVSSAQLKSQEGKLALFSTQNQQELQEFHLQASMKH